MPPDNYIWRLRSPRVHGSSPTSITAFPPHDDALTSKGIDAAGGSGDGEHVGSKGIRHVARRSDDYVGCVPRNRESRRREAVSNHLSNGVVPDRWWLPGTNDPCIRRPEAQRRVHVLGVRGREPSTVRHQNRRVLGVEVGAGRTSESHCGEGNGDPSHREAPFRERVRSVVIGPAPPALTEPPSNAGDPPPRPKATARPPTPPRPHHTRSP